MELKVAFFNPTESKVYVDGIDLSCVCTHAELETYTINAKSSEFLKLTIDTSKRTGSITAEIKLKWHEENRENAPQTSVLHVKYHNRSLAIANPEVIDLGEISFDEQNKTFEIKVKRGSAAVEWNGLQASSKHAKFTVDQNNTDEFTVQGAINPDSLWVGNFRDIVSISLTNNGKPVGTAIKSVITANIVSNLEVRPKSFWLGSVPVKGLITKKVSVVSRDEPVSIISVSTQSNDAVSINDFHGIFASDNHAFLRICPRQKGEFSAVAFLKVVGLRSGKVQKLAIPCLGFASIPSS